MNEVNDIAIEIAKHIEKDLLSAFFSNRTPAVALEESPASSISPTFSEPPHFYRVRRIIVEVLERYIGVLYAEEHFSERVEENIPLELVKEIRHQQRRKMAMAMVERLLEDPDVPESWKYRDDNILRSTRLSLVFVKYGKLRRDREFLER